MKRVFLIAAFLGACVSLPGTASAVAPPVAAAACAAPTVHHVPRPFRSDSPDLLFQYAFDLRPATSAGAITIVYLPGGPGQSSIGDETLAAEFPENAGLLTTDPRGVGCNSLQVSDPGSFFRTEELANDVVAAIAEAKLENYAIYGVSYGTILASVVAHKLEKSDLPQPKAVFLEGTFGRAFEANEFENNYIAQWERIRGTLDPQTLKGLNARNLMGVPGQAWKYWIEQMLAYGDYPKPGTNLINLMLAQVLPEADAATRAGRLAQIAKYNQPLETSGAHLAYDINLTCHEIKPGGLNPILLKLEKGHLVLDERLNRCKPGSFDRAFNIENYEFSAPTFYFSGDQDPNASPAQSDYHFAHHTQAPRTLLRIQGGGHNALTKNEGNDCARSVFQTALNHPEGLEQVLHSSACPFPFTIQSAKPGQD